MADAEPPTDRQVAEAIEWLARFESGEVDASERQAFQYWLAQSPQHTLAWQRLDRAARQFCANTALSSQQALHSLDAAERRLREKRRTLKTLASFGGIGLGLWLTRDVTGVGPAGRYLYGQTLADISTVAGEQRSLTLQDGGKLLLNTQSALDVDFSARPELVLHYGELAIADSGGAQSRAGGNLFSPAVGSEFTLYKQTDSCHLQVIAGQVDCTFGGRHEYRVAAGQGLLQQGGEIRRTPVNPHRLSWRQGLLTAERTALGDFVAQLARYRPGYLGCADDITGLTMSGSFPIADTDAILDNLCRTLPIRQQRMSRYWVRLLPA